MLANQILMDLTGTLHMVKEISIWLNKNFGWPFTAVRPKANCSETAQVMKNSNTMTDRYN